MSTSNKSIIGYVAVGVGAAAAAAMIYYIYSKNITKRSADEAAAEIRANREKVIEQLINDNLAPLHEQQKSLENKIAEIDRSIKENNDDEDFLRRLLADRKRYEEQLLAVNVTIDSIKNTEATHLRIAHAFAMQQVNEY
jgi:septal ring factor EnvC (AmiA/AmiB activator)